MPDPNGYRWFYPVLTLAISGTVFWGFYYTYFGPVVAGAYPDVPAALHVHGWSFFLWYLLLPVQAMLMATGRRRLHMSIGLASIALAAVMVFTGILSASVRINNGLTASDPDQFTTFWKEFGLLITYSLVLFVGFYSAAIARRKEPAVHKRLMILAAASPLPAAVFRVIVGLGGFFWLATPGWVMPASFFLPGVFIVAGMVYDRTTRDAIHPAYVVGLPIFVALFALGLLLAGTPTSEGVSRFIALFARAFGFLY